MSRRKKSSAGRRGGAAGSEQNGLRSTDRAAAEPNPPRPNKVFLGTTGLLLAAWIAFLIVLALTTWGAD
ncbi:MAG: hypothetical protein A2V98_06740 [Planctomycetes bacterium RBG_16_64_12]|nr:MAG: hypothetical protein A2V98_06740 [Planctomycetes bacterium RBG_16_64_12]